LNGGKKATQKGPVQMDLFRQAENLVISKLNTADISRMTPLEALNFLNELQENTKTDKT
jgi:hypothetical protein